MAGRERDGRFVVPELRGGAAGKSEPAGVVGAEELVHGSLQRGGGGWVAVGEQYRQPIEQTVGRARRAGRRRGARGRGDVGRAVMGAETAGEDRRFERFEVCVACEPDVERFECLRGVEQQARCVAFLASCEREVGSQPLEPGAVEVVEGARSGQGQQFASSGKGPCVELGVSGGECARGAPVGFGCE